MRSLIVLVLAGLATMAMLAAPAHAEKPCRSVSSRAIAASHVHASRSLSCRSARRVLRRYFARVLDSAQTNGGCAEARHRRGGCRVRRFRCRSRYLTGQRRIVGRCRQGSRYVRFRERDRGSG